MRGIQINNYFNNHITLNGKKVNHDPQHITEKPKTKHFNHNLQQSDNNAIDLKPYSSKSNQLVPKKRTNTLVELKKQIPSKRSTSAQRPRNAISAKKKDEPGQYETEKEEESVPLISNRKLKANSSKGGLGKRSKSTIIKTGTLQLNKEFSTIKKEPKKLTSNPTDESMKVKTKRKKSARMIDQSKQLKKEAKPMTARRQFIPIASKQVPKKQKLNIKMDKNDAKQDRKNQLAQIKSKLSSASKRKLSKPASARQKKTKNSNKFIEELKQKYENQTILQGSLTNRIRNIEQPVDSDFLSVMSSLQKVLTSVGSKQKLKKELDLINQKLKQFRIASQSDKSQPFQSQRQQDYQIIQDKRSQNIYQQIGEQQKPKQQEIISNDPSQQVLHVKYQQQKIQKQEQQQKLQNIQDEIEEHQHQHQHQQIDKSNPLIGKRNHQFIFDDAFASQINHEALDINDRKKQIQELKQFKTLSANLMKKAGLKQLQIPQDQEEVKQSEKEVKQEEKQVVEDEPAPVFDRKGLFISNQSNISNNSNISVSSSSNPSILKQQKFPFNPKSPKFDQVQLMNIVNLKQQILKSKHDKMSQLMMRVPYSPRSYQSRINSLNEKQNKQKMEFESFKKQAEQMTSMLSQIRKDKEEIQGIDQLIRNQKWDQARKLLQNAENKEKLSDHYLMAQEHEEEAQQKVFQIHKRQQETDNWQKEEGWQRVRIKKSDVQNNQFVDIGQMTGRPRRKAEAVIDIDQECGGTEQSVEIDGVDEDDVINYPGNEEDDQKMQDGMIKLVKISEDLHEGNSSGEQPKLANANDNVFVIQCEQMGSRQFDNSVIDKNQSNMSGISSQSDRKGFTTNLYFIKEYCIALCQFVRDNDVFKAQFKYNISKPLEFDLLNILKELRTEDISNYLYAKRANKVAISQIVWNSFNAQYDSLKYNSNAGKTGEKYNFEKEQELIFLRMIYEVLNESLDSERPGSQFGKAFPWKDHAKHLKNLKQLNQPQKDNIEAYDLMFGVAIARIIQWGSCLCGFLPDTVELQNTQIDEPYVNHIRQTRMAFLLEKMMAAEQNLMTNFEMQETQIEYRLSKMIMQDLLKEVPEQIELMKQVQEQ